MPDLISMLERSLGPQVMQQLSKRLGASEGSTASAASALIPILIGGLSRNAQKPGGAQALNDALKDHDGSVLNNLSALTAKLDTSNQPTPQSSSSTAGAAGAGSNLNPKATDGAGILSHVLGSGQASVYNGIGKATGMSSGAVGSLASVLAPMVMGALGKVKQEKNLDANGVASVLNQETKHLETQAQGVHEGGLKKLLDSNHDGKINLLDDIGKVGMALGAAFLLSRGRRKL